MKRRTFLQLLGISAVSTPVAAKTKKVADDWDTAPLPDYPNEVAFDGIMPDIPPRDGFKQRWVRTELANEPDLTNMMRRFNDGWRRRDPMTLPPRTPAQVRNIEGIGDVIGIRGMILMERPVWWKG